MAELLTSIRILYFHPLCRTQNVAIPGKDMGLLWRNGAIMAIAAVALYAAGACVLQSSSLLGIR